MSHIHAWVEQNLARFLAQNQKKRRLDGKSQEKQLWISLSQKQKVNLVEHLQLKSTFCWVSVEPKPNQSGPRSRAVGQKHSSRISLTHDLVFADGDFANNTSNLVARHCPSCVSLLKNRLVTVKVMFYILSPHPLLGKWIKVLSEQMTVHCARGGGKKHKSLWYCSHKGGRGDMGGRISYKSN